MPLSVSFAQSSLLSRIICKLSTECYFEEEIDAEKKSVLLTRYLLKAEKISRDLYLLLYKFACDDNKSICDFFSDTTTKWISQLAGPLNESTLLDEYNILKKDYLDYISGEEYKSKTRYELYIDDCLLACGMFNLEETDINRIRQVAYSIERFPVALAFECYIKVMEPQIRDFIYNETCAFLDSYPREYFPENKKIINRMEYFYNNFTRAIRNAISYEDLMQFGCLQYTEINNSEGTHFNESLISQLKYSVCRVGYLDDTTYYKEKKIKDKDIFHYRPSWLYFPDSPGVKIPKPVSSSKATDEDKLFSLINSCIKEYKKSLKDFVVDIQPFFVHQIEPPQVIITKLKEDVPEIVKDKICINPFSEDDDTFDDYDEGGVYDVADYHFERETSEFGRFWRLKENKFYIYLLPGKWDFSPIPEEIMKRIKLLIQDYPEIKIEDSKIIFLHSLNDCSPFNKWELLRKCGLSGEQVSARLSMFLRRNQITSL